MFEYCMSLKELDLKSFDTANVVNMEAVFYECSNLEELDLSNFDTKNVTNDYAMFYNCKKLESVKTDDELIKAKIYDIMVLGYDGMSVG